MQTNYPFAAVVGQGSYKLALSLTAVCPEIGGVLVSGPRGSAKSTLARGFADMLPGTQRPFVTLPLGASEEMLIGTLDLQTVMTNQAVSFQPGLLYKAHEGVLYVDEVNLLPDHLVDVLLDVAASGVNTVERDGVSESHESKFILLGTMNPDEGELRPQLLDRFGLFVQQTNQYSKQERIDIVMRREQFERDPQAFQQQYNNENIQLMQSIQQAAVCFDEVVCSDELRSMIAEHCAAAQVDGMRADIVWSKAARAHAALHARLVVTEYDVLSVKELVLGHRRNVSPDNQPNANPPSFSRPQPREPQEKDIPSDAQQDSDWGQMDAQPQASADHFYDIPLTALAPSSKPVSTDDALGYSRGVERATSSYGSKRASSYSKRIHWFKTLAQNAAQWPLKELFYKPQKTTTSIVNVVLLDTSASVLKAQSFAKAKALLISISKQAYLKRESLVVLGFGNQQVDLLLPMVRAPKDINDWLNSLTAGGGTPLRQAVLEAQKLQNTIRCRTPSAHYRNFLITDGKTNETLEHLALKGKTTLVDIEQSEVKRGRGKSLAQMLGADYLPLQLILTKSV